jgi:hypothetical protein
VLSLPRAGPSDPTYAGKPLSAWLKDLNSSGPGSSASAVHAIQQLGTNAVPRLWAEAAADHESLPKALAALVLNRQRVFKVHVVTGSDHQNIALRAFRALGTNGAVAVAQGLTNSNRWIRHGCVGQWELCNDYPEIIFEPLFARLKDPEPAVRARAANALGMVHMKSPRVVPVLVKMLEDKDEWARCMAAVGLDLYGPIATSAVPALLLSLTNSSADFRSFATNAIKKLEPQAATAAGIK